MTSYGQAVARAVGRANRAPRRRPVPTPRLVLPHWHPNQLRHTHGTAVRGRFGLEAAQVALGTRRPTSPRCTPSGTSPWR